MAEYNINSQFTLLERMKQSIDGKRLLPILDVMDKLGVPDFLQDVPYFEANRGLTHMVVRTTSRPASSRRNFYEGVTPTDITTQDITEPLILFEQWSSVDEQHVETVENGNEVRANRDRIKIAKILEDFVDAIFNDARTSGPKYVDGFKQRLNVLSYPGHTTTTLPYVWDNGGTGTALTSAYVVEWAPNANYCLYPSGVAGKAGVMGVNATDLGKQTVVTATSPLTVYRAYQSQFTKWAGLACEDDRKVARIANIETRTTITTGRFNEDVLIRVLAHGRFNRVATRIYVNPFLKADIDIRAKDMLNGWNIMDVFGRPVPTFQGIPVRVLDSTVIPSTESALA